MSSPAQISSSHPFQFGPHELHQVAFTYPTEFLQYQLPEYYPSIPVPRRPLTHMSEFDPFAAETDDVRHTPRIKKPIHKNGNASSTGYIKFQLRSIHNSPQFRGNRHSPPSSMHRDHEQAASSIEIPRPVSDPSKLDSMDEKLLNFCKTSDMVIFSRLTHPADVIGYSDGRTLIQSDNFWRENIPAMMFQSKSVKHSTLALAATYVLDYFPNDWKLLERSNHHYRMGRKMIAEAFHDPQSHLFGNEEEMIVAISLLAVDDVVTWEQRRPQNQDPRWYTLVKAAKRILDHENQGVKYHRAENVQLSKTIREISCWIAYVHIITELVTPSEFLGPKTIFPWLLYGGASMQTRIHGVTGASPELLHIFAQITDLSARLKRVRCAFKLCSLNSSIANLCAL